MPGGGGGVVATPQIFRSPLRSLLRERLPARHLPRLRWQHQKRLPILLHQGRVRRDHMGLCRPTGPTRTRRSDKAQFGSTSLPLGGVHRTNERSASHPFSSRIQQCSKNPFASLYVTISLRRRKPRPKPRWLTSGLQNGCEPLGSHTRSVYTRSWGGTEVEPQSVERKLAAIFAADVEGYTAA